MNDSNSTIPHVPTQLYLISPLDVGGDFPQRLARALEAGAGHVTAFQFRVKGFDGSAGQHEAAALAQPLQEICAAHEVAFIVNDDIALAKRLKADGVHLGQEDGTVAEARDALGMQAQIGVTCHASRHLAMEAGEAGADYVAFGAFFPSTTKDKGNAERPQPEILEWWTQIFELPCVAIGGITPENCVPLIEAGADFLAVSGAVWNGDEAKTVQAFVEVLEGHG
ncbi:thiamine phosphate synthase [Alteriqipengyuania lutimaris]|uniref:Thiamine-phosphate synthase n=1 Tax=Alteriqipengyuania lutimaris TaxID=1538146 RepID=A0A395LPH5_9SPHN|nr:thiamine phosphate synthase [Alteriqipengyuania lutimaris]MBB3033049.1 thiamine-phosphate pyrophosphorylase [Alteriqipengyuania lutimaris]RDS78645.1 thiamine phosphate synthase [Alteriqipengyuania lutimaris]